MAEKILIVEDEEKIKQALKSYFERRTKYEVHTASDGIEAIEVARKVRPDLIITDVVMPGKDGIEAIQEISKFLPDAPCIIITGFAMESSAIRALKLGVRDYIKKPFDPSELVNSAENLLSIARLRRESEAMRRTLELFRARLQEIMALVSSTAKLAAPVQPSELYDKILGVATKAMKAKAGLLLLAERSRKALAPKANVALRDASEEVALGAGIAGKVAASGQAICAAPAAGGRVIGEMGVGVERDRRSVLALPLVRDGGVIGVLELFDKEGGAPFDKNDMETASLLAGLASIAIAENQADEQTNELLLRALKLAVEHEAGAEGRGQALQQAVETIGEVTSRLDLLGDRERVVSLAGLIREIAAHGPRAVEFCAKVLEEFREVLKERDEV
jgi:DNA-binding response OmpR family regulator